MKMIVTCGPAYEPIDAVRRITNHSTGELGTLLANALTAKGHEVVCFRGALSTYPKRPKVARLVEFTTNSDLNVKLSIEPYVDVFFHTAALSDFRVKENALLHTPGSGKISSDQERWVLELEPQPKILSSLRKRFPNARIIGWKYEVEGGSDDAISRAMRQILNNSIDACILNGPAFSKGFGLVTKDGLQRTFANKRTLVRFLTANHAKIAKKIT